MRVSIRLKILLLVTFTLTTSLVAYLVVGTRMMVEDKIPYIFDFNYARVTEETGKINNDIDRISAQIHTLAALIGKKPDQKSTDLLSARNDQFSKENRTNGLLFLRPSGADRFSIDVELGSNASELRDALAKAGWGPQVFEKNDILIETFDAKRVLMGGKTLDLKNRPLYYLTLFNLQRADSDQKAGESGDSLIYVLDSQVKPLIAPTGTGLPGAQAVSEFAKTLNQEGFPSGVKEWKSAEQDFLVAYHRTKEGNLTVLSMIPKSKAFSSVKVMILRSTALGIAVLLLALGFALTLAKKMTARLREMWLATQNIASGDFSVRVSTSTKSEDEVADLAKSLNLMSDKINELMIRTAEKARMDKELETAQAVQQRFSPAGSFRDPQIALAGQFIPAEECGGDWWNYARVGKYMVIALGDVTGHGVHAALVTAAVYGAFSLVVTQIDPRQPAKEIIRQMIAALNHAVYVSSGGETSMTFLLSLIDVETGMMTYANAAHHPPYLFVQPPAAREESFQDHLKTLMEGRSIALGIEKTLEVQSAEVQLQPRDLVFWHTDGVWEKRPDDEKKLNKLALLKEIATLAKKSEGKIEPICQGIVDEVVNFFGPGQHRRPDDITVVVGIYQGRGPDTGAPK